MGGFTSFMPQTKTVLLVTSATPGTPTSTNITQAALGISRAFPPQVLIVNTGGTAIFVSFTTQTQTIAAPTVGPSGAQLGVILIPNVIQTLTLPTGQTLWVNDVSTGIAIPYYFVLGEGI